MSEKKIIKSGSFELGNHFLICVLSKFQYNKLKERNPGGLCHNSLYLLCIHSVNSVV